MISRRKLRQQFGIEHDVLEIKQAEARLQGNQELIELLDYEEDEMLRERQQKVDFLESLRVTQVADALDVELPGEQERSYWSFLPSEGGVLNSKGRALVRERIHEEKKRNFEQKAKWVQLMMPFLAAIAGVIGTITGLVAVLHHK